MHSEDIVLFGEEFLKSEESPCLLMVLMAREEHSRSNSGMIRRLVENFSRLGILVAELLRSRPYLYAPLSFPRLRGLVD